MVVSKR